MLIGLISLPRFVNPTELALVGVIASGIRVKDMPAMSRTLHIAAQVAIVTAASILSYRVLHAVLSQSVGQPTTAILGSLGGIAVITLVALTLIEIQGRTQSRSTFSDLATTVAVASGVVGTYHLIAANPTKNSLIEATLITAAMSAAFLTVNRSSSTRTRRTPLEALRSIGVRRSLLLGSAPALLLGGGAVLVGAPQSIGASIPAAVANLILDHEQVVASSSTNIAAMNQLASSTLTSPVLVPFSGSIVAGNPNLHLQVRVDIHGRLALKVPARFFISAQGIPTTSGTIDPSQSVAELNLSNGSSVATGGVQLLSPRSIAGVLRFPNGELFSYQLSTQPASYGHWSGYLKLTPRPSGTPSSTYTRST